MTRLEDQIGWYDKKSAYNQRMFKVLKAATILIAISIPLCAAVGATTTITAILGSLIALIEAVQQMNQYQQRWITYRSTCEALKHEKFLFLGNAGPYASAANPLALLAERVESQVSQENAKWASMQEQSPKAQGATGTP
jgi:hypothetical protein